MDKFSKIFERTNIQQIREFLINGAECGAIDPRNYEERIEEALTPVATSIEQRYPDMTEFDEIMGKVFDYAGTNRDVYMEIGLQCGFILATQIFGITQEDKQ